MGNFFQDAWDDLSGRSAAKKAKKANLKQQAEALKEWESYAEGSQGALAQLMGGVGAARQQWGQERDALMAQQEAMQTDYGMAQGLFGQEAARLGGQEQAMLGDYAGALDETRGGYERAIAAQQAGVQEARGLTGAAGQALMQQQAMAGEQSMAAAREAGMGGVGGAGGSAALRLGAGAAAQAGAAMGGVQAGLLGQQAELSQAGAAGLAGLETGRGASLANLLTGQAGMRRDLGAQRFALAGQRADMFGQQAGMRRDIGAQRFQLAGQQAGLETWGGQAYANLQEAILRQKAAGRAQAWMGVQHKAGPSGFEMLGQVAGAVKDLTS